MAWSLWFDAALHRPSEVVPIASAQELRDHLGRLIDQGYGTATLKPGDEEGDRLTLGVEGALAFIQYAKFNTGTTKVLFASTGHDTGEQAVEFNVGNTPTEMPLRLCIPAGLMLRIAEFYFKRRQLPDWVQWDEERWPRPSNGAEGAGGSGSEDIPF